MRSLRWMIRLGTTCTHQSAQESDLAELGLTEAMTQEAAWYVSDGRLFRGHEAIAMALRTSRYGAVRLAGRVIGSQLLRAVMSRAYSWVASHRHQLPGGTPACELPGSP
jgi:predicted DCC family thiol-disulfide oxidoreductase YuxK